jgi:lambda family phage tail tape measure protein
MPMNVDAIKNQAQAATSALDFLKKEANMSAAYNLMNDTFFSPVENLFSNFLQTGKFAFKEFAQSILKAISQIVAKIIATGVVTLLASLFIPGFAAAGGGVGASLLSGITGALGFGGGGFGGSKSVAAPNFGGVSGGGMQMAGAVNLTLRGSDLVGSINRTNATINRVG